VTAPTETEGRAILRRFEEAAAFRRWDAAEAELALYRSHTRDMNWSRHRYAKEQGLERRRDILAAVMFRTWGSLKDG
jgi:hypothetical protein